MARRNLTDVLADIINATECETVEEAVQFLARVARTQGHVAEGYFAFYTIMTGREPPDHVKRWIRGIYANKAEDRGSLIFAFRGSWKTTSISMLFVAYRMGLEPWLSNLILQNNDATAATTSLAIAEIIDKDPRFLQVFPDVRPDKAKGWGAQGYWVRDFSLSDDEWTKLTNVSRDPSLLGLGISSGSVIGKHPTGVLLMDDIHDEKNTVSETERTKIIKVVTDTVLPMAVVDATKKEGEQLQTWTLTVGTPWHEHDAYHYLRGTGEFGFHNSPLLMPVSEDAEGAVYFDHKKLQGWFRLMWADNIPYDAVISLYNKTGHRGFGRMYLLSLVAAMDLGLPFHSFPHKDIPKDEYGQPSVPVSAGVDYASMLEIRGKHTDPKNRSKFALAYGVVLPNGSAVIMDGIVGHFSQLKCEGHVNKIQGMFRNFRTTGVEMNGKGEEFFSLLSRNPNLDLLPFWVKGNKESRLELQLAPWIEMGKIMISDDDTPFLNELRKALWEFPYGNLDVLDAVYAFAKTIPDVLQVDRSPAGGIAGPNDLARQQRRQNPFSAFGRRRYGD